MHYSTLFDITNQPFPWWFPTSGLLIGFTCLPIAFRSYSSQSSPTHRYRALLVGIVGATLGGAWFLITMLMMYPAYQYCQYALQAGEYTIVEGRVENFQPSSDQKGQPPESFTIQEISFSYKDRDLGCGFHHTSGNGGPIRANLPVRITYMPSMYNTILRLEIGNTP